jgi:type IV secretory pathway VirB3-like protein
MRTLYMLSQREETLLSGKRCTMMLHSLSCAASNMSNNSSSGNCSVDADLEMVVYSSPTERILNLFVLITALLFTVLGQTSVIVTICKIATLHTQHFAIIVACCATDIVMVVCHCVLYIWCFVTGRMDSLILCRILSSVGGAAAFASASLIGLMAYERFVYFCHPMKYDRWLRRRIVAFGIGAITTAPLIYMAVSEIYPGREFHATILGCNLRDMSIHPIFQGLVFVLPTMFSTAFCSVKIWRLSVQRSVAPSVPQDPVLATPTRQAAKALRVLLLVSGVFWAMTLPVAITRSLYFRSGVTWQDLDSRRSYFKALFLRYNYYIYALVSPLLNPIIYYYSRKDLRMGLRKVCGLENAVAPQEGSIYTTQNNGS